MLAARLHQHIAPPTRIFSIRVAALQPPKNRLSTSSQIYHTTPETVLEKSNLYRENFYTLIHLNRTRWHGRSSSSLTIRGLSTSSTDQKKIPQPDLLYEIGIFCFFNARLCANRVSITSVQKAKRVGGRYSKKFSYFWLYLRCWSIWSTTSPLRRQTVRLIAACDCLCNC